MSNTETLIKPIIFETYGKGAMAEGLVNDLARYIDAYEGDDRQRAVMIKCWDWFSGGSTAASVAGKIEAALEAREEDRVFEEMRREALAFGFDWTKPPRVGPVLPWKDSL